MNTDANNRTIPSPGTYRPRLAIGNRMGPNPTFPRFDWENRICVKLDFNDLCAMLQVFRGECESIAGAMYLVSFGIPMLVSHDTTAYRREAREVCNVAA